MAVFIDFSKYNVDFSGEFLDDLPRGGIVFGSSQHRVIA